MIGNDMIAKIEKIFKALGDKSRLRILNMLGEKSLCVCEITQVLKLSQSTVSGHLRVLKDTGLVEDEKDGLWVEYHLCKDEKFNDDIMDLILDALKSDPKMEEERKKAFQANREAICKK
jgi:ArsR family transcriptional regulator